MLDAATPNRPNLPAEIARRRTFAIISHPDAGKTTLTEKFLLYGGAIQMAGQVRAKGEAPPSGPTKYQDSWALADPAKMKALAKKAAAAGVWNAPTYMVIAKSYEYAMDQEAFEARPEYAYVDPNTAQWWSESISDTRPFDDTAKKAAANQRFMIKALYDAGAPLLIGSDTPNPFIIQGFSIHEELAAFVEAGIPAADVLRIATAEAARFLDEEGEWGVVAPGARADLALLDGDPLTDLSVMRDPVGVMMNGRWSSRAAIAEALEAFKEEIDRRRGEASAEEGADTPRD